MDIETSFCLLGAVARRDWRDAIEIVGTRPAIDYLAEEYGRVVSDAAAAAVVPSSDRVASRIDAAKVRSELRRAHGGDVVGAVDAIEDIIACATAHAMIEQSLEDLRAQSLPPCEAEHVVQVCRDYETWYDEAGFDSRDQASDYIALRYAAAPSGSAICVRFRPDPDPDPEPEPEPVND